MFLVAGGPAAVGALTLNKSRTSPVIVAQPAADAVVSVGAAMLDASADKRAHVSDTSSLNRDSGADARLPPKHARMSPRLSPAVDKAPLPKLRLPSPDVAARAAGASHSPSPRPLRMHAPPLVPTSQDAPMPLAVDDIEMWGDFGSYGGPDALIYRAQLSMFLLRELQSAVQLARERNRRSTKVLR